jgi:hypothetical protein
MRRLITAAAFVVIASTATAKQEPPGMPIHYNTPYRDLSSSAANQAFLRNLQSKIEAAGYSGVDVEPRLFFATAMDKDVNPVALLVDADKETAMEIDGQGPTFDKLFCRHGKE